MTFWSPKFIIIAPPRRGSMSSVPSCRGSRQGYSGFKPVLWVLQLTSILPFDGILILYVLMG